MRLILNSFIFAFLFVAGFASTSIAEAADPWKRLAVQKSWSFFQHKSGACFGSSYVPGQEGSLQFIGSGVGGLKLAIGFKQRPNVVEHSRLKLWIDDNFLGEHGLVLSRNGLGTIDLDMTDNLITALSQGNRLHYQLPGQPFRSQLLLQDVAQAAAAIRKCVQRRARLQQAEKRFDTEKLTKFFAIYSDIREQTGYIVRRDSDPRDGIIDIRFEDGTTGWVYGTLAPAWSIEKFQSIMISGESEICRGRYASAKRPKLILEGDEIGVMTSQCQQGNKTVVSVHRVIRTQEGAFFQVTKYGSHTDFQAEDKHAQGMRVAAFKVRDQ